MESLEERTTTELLQLQSNIIAELTRRNVIRTSNNPVGDYAESLFIRAFGWDQAPNSAAGYDAKDSSGFRYQIKCRRLTTKNTSRQLSALRNLKSRPFDVLAGVLFDQNFDVLRAALIPVEIVVAQSVYITHVNAHRFMLRDSIWTLGGVHDVTAHLVRTQLSF